MGGGFQLVVFGCLEGVASHYAENYELLWLDDLALPFFGWQLRRLDVVIAITGR